jgi:hypothetical protein
MCAVLTYIQVMVRVVGEDDVRTTAANTGPPTAWVNTSGIEGIQTAKQIVGEVMFEAVAGNEDCSCCGRGLDQGPTVHRSVRTHRAQLQSRWCT